MKPKKLSKEMKRCLDIMQTEESLFRANGGLWTAKNVPMIPNAIDEVLVPEWYFKKPTIHGLIERGLLMAWNSKVGKFGVYLTEVKLAEDFAEKIKLFKYEPASISN